MGKERRDINIICDRDINHNRLKYTIDFINNHPLIPQGINIYLNSDCKNCLKIFYSNKRLDSEICIPLQHIFYSENIPEKGSLIANKYFISEQEVFSVETQKKSADIFFENKSFGFDLFEAIFFHISRYEEVFLSKGDLDKHRRMNQDSQFLFKNNLHYQPVVDRLIFEFFKSLNYDIKNQKSTFILTHDIDIIRKFSGVLKLPKSIVRILLMKKGIKGVMHIIKSYFRAINNKEHDPYYTFDWLFTDKDQYLKKIVFFVAGGKSRYDLFNKSYLKEMSDIIRKAKSKGYDIGLHPSYFAFDNKKMFENEKKLLESVAGTPMKYTRSHFLRLDIQKTFEIIEILGFEYDSTLGYADDIGFRCGTGYSYHPYNFLQERKWTFKEIPLVIMDSALMKKCDQNTELFYQKYSDFIKSNINNTNITINIHNSTFEQNPFLFVSIH